MKIFGTVEPLADSLEGVNSKMLPPLPLSALLTLKFSVLVECQPAWTIKQPPK